jgi:hypothetical protein
MLEKVDSKRQTRLVPPLFRVRFTLCFPAADTHRVTKYGISHRWISRCYERWFLMKLSRSLLLLLALVVAALFAGCGGGGGGATVAVVKGLVSDNTGNPIAGVTITAGTATALSGADGTFTLSVTPAANLKVSASKAGLASTFDVVTLAVGQTMPVNFTLVAVGKSNPLTNLIAAQAVADDPRGAQVTLPANSIVDSTGAAVDTATVDVTTGLPTDPNYTENFPGLFVGTGKPGAAAEIAIESFGYTTIDITSGGKKCNLAPGKNADIAIPVAAGADPGTLTIDLWSLDEATGKWVHEGVATRDATVNPVVYRATVTHFSTYNLDRAIESAIPFTITVENSTGAKIAGAGVTITSTNQTGGGMWEGRGVTGANGTIRFTQVPQGQVAVSVVYGSQAGTGYLYDVANNEATMTITLFTAVTRTFTVVYMNNGVETPIANLNVSVMGEGGGPGGGHAFVNGITNAQGQVTLNLKEGMAFYMYNANTNIGGMAYGINGNANTIAAIPAKWVLTQP